MTDDRMALTEALQKADDGNVLRNLAATVLQILMAADGEGLIGAGRYERSGERATWRNGYPVSTARLLAAIVHALQRVLPEDTGQSPEERSDDPGDRN